MSVKYHMILRNGDDQIKVSRSGACFGSLASGMSEERDNFRYIRFIDGEEVIVGNKPNWAVADLKMCRFDEIVYEVYEALSRGYVPSPSGGNVETRMLGGVSYTNPIVKTRLRAFLSDLLDIKKELPWMSIVSVDLKNMWVKVATDHPADQVFQCLSSIRNVIAYTYDGYCELRGQGFSKKTSFLLAQNFPKYRNAMGVDYWKPNPICDYMMVNHAFMRPVDVQRLFRGEITFKQWNLKGSRGYFKPTNHHHNDPERFDNEVVAGLSNLYNNTRFSFRENWSTFLSTQNPEEGYVMGEHLRRIYLGQVDESIPTEAGIQLMNEWLQIINRG